MTPKHRPPNHPDFAYNVIPGKYLFQLYKVKEFAYKVNIYYISTDEKYQFERLPDYDDDFGPLSLSQISKYCREVGTKLHDFKQSQIFLFHVALDRENERANAALLVGSFCVLLGGLTIEEISKIAEGEFYFQFYKGYSKLHEDYSEDDVYPHHCFTALAKASLCQLYDVRLYNVEKADELGSPEKGNIHWIVPDKLLTFPCPQPDAGSNGQDANFYLRYFQKTNVSAIIRLIPATYSSEVFTDAGIQVHEINFSDESTPSRENFEEFMKIIDKASGAVAVHCGAGQGRTGLMVCIYLMDTYLFTALEAIAFFRMLRAGSVLKNQQLTLMQLQSYFMTKAERARMMDDVELHQKKVKGLYGFADTAGELPLQPCTFSVQERIKKRVKRRIEMQKSQSNLSVSSQTQISSTSSGHDVDSGHDSSFGGGAKNKIKQAFGIPGSASKLSATNLSAGSSGSEIGTGSGAGSSGDKTSFISGLKKKIKKAP